MGQHAPEPPVGQAKTRLTHDYHPPLCPASLTLLKLFFKSTPSLHESKASGNLFWALLLGDPAQDKYLLHRGLVCGYDEIRLEKPLVGAWLALGKYPVVSNHDSYKLLLRDRKSVTRELRQT